MDWLTISALVLVFGMAGWWGGVLQHAHQSVSDGGVLTDRPQVLARDITQTVTSNSIALTNVLTFTIQANTVATGQGLRIYARGNMTQNGFVNAGSSLVRIQIGGSLIINLPLSGATLSQSATPRAWAIELFLLNLGATNIRSMGTARILTATSAGDVAPALEERSINSLNADFTTNLDITVDVQNSQADPAVSTAKNFVLIEKV